MGNQRSTLTPPQIARRYGISDEKVLTWIRNGELRAINIAAKSDGRPRYAVHESDLLEFERRREVVPPPKSPKRRKKKMDIIEFF